MKNALIYTLIGGDMRQVRLAAMLAAEDHTVRISALEHEGLPQTVIRYKSVRQAASDADCVVLPMPCIDESGKLNAPLFGESLLLEDVFASLEPGQTVMGGRIPASAFELAGRMGLHLYDYLEREELAVANAVITAEGAIQIAMEELPATIHKSRFLVVGFGRIGKMLAHFLRGLGADVTVSARRASDLAWIDAYGYASANTGELDGRLSGYSVIINTVPAPVLTRPRLRSLDTGCLCIDLASKPGGVDFIAASELGVKAIWALSLPGKVAPDTSGEIIKKTIENILMERERDLCSS